MPQLNLKPSHKAVRDYYATLRQYDRHNATHEGAVSSPFETLLTVCAKQVDATLIPQFAMRAPSGSRIVLDGVIFDEYGLPFAYWEAKDMDDNLTRAVQEKREAGYPLDNTLFQNPQHGILYQNGEQVFDVDITDPTRLIAVLQYFFAAPPAALANWHAAVAEFKEKFPALGRKAPAEIIWYTRLILHCSKNGCKHLLKYTTPQLTESRGTTRKRQLKTSLIRLTRVSNGVIGLSNHWENWS